MKNKPILIIGGTGKTGRRVAERLTARGLPIRIGSRSSDPSFDWGNPSTWAASLQGAESVYITYYPDLALPGAAASIGAFAEQAVKQGIKRLVLLSGRGEEEAQLSEKALRDSGADWTILRASWFCQNFSESFLLDSVLSGSVILPAADVAEPFIDADDIADVAVAALTEDSHIGKLYELTGPRALTFKEATEEIALASGRDVRYVQVTSEQFISALAQQDMPDYVLTLLTELFTKVLDGRNSHLTDGVQLALKREPRDFADYARDTADAGIWGVPNV
ncbi:NmrA family transcriptional regulator [Paenibacillus sp. FSL A5-0031]|uniref:NmrA family NAD(P)-binding protein n=1 Tax=Paenibacillus sp. FSL A5-0031 TaxID=1920420 RepID=UPI00096F51B8|nr:NAD(P)H-binding protein [Paenibacillus sp. FSL A5-0031]OME86222.1 NmrA family transcriptional regulator [Paenibacillus sp. FSL A5-0031]